MTIIKKDNHLILKVPDHKPSYPLRYKSKLFPKGVILNPEYFKDNIYSTTLDEMEMHLESNSIDFVNYLPQHKALIVGFYTQGCYVYKNVTEEEFSVFLTSYSRGSFFHKYIKSHEYKQIPEHFTVDDVKNYLENNNIDFKKPKSINALVSVFEASNKLVEKRNLIENKQFPVNDFIGVIEKNYWLSISALKNPNLSSENKTKLEQLRTQEYISIPKLFKRNSKAKK